MAQAKKNIFNLLKPIEAPKSSWDKVYIWISTRAKAVIFIVEILMVLAFVSKVVVDNVGKNNLQEFTKVTDELRFYETNQESELRAIQLKDLNYKRLWNGSSSMSTILLEVYGFIQNPSSNINVKVDGATLSVVGVDNLDELKKLEESLKASKNFSNVFIKNLTQEQQDIATETGQFELVAQISQNVLKRQAII